MNEPQASYVVQSLDMATLSSNPELAKQVGRAIAELIDDKRYQLLVSIVQCEQRRRGVELAEYVGTQKAVDLAAEIKSALSFNAIAQTLAAQYKDLVEAETQDQDVDRIEGLGDQALG